MSDVATNLGLATSDYTC